MGWRRGLFIFSHIRGYNNFKQSLLNKQIKRSLNYSRGEDLPKNQNMLLISILYILSSLIEKMCIKGSSPKGGQDIQTKKEALF
jgi:hypothetical protein